MKKISVISLLSLTLLSCSFFQGNSTAINKDENLFISKKTTFQQLKDSLNPHLVNATEWWAYAEKNNLKKSFKPGKYDLKKGESQKELLRKLINGWQSDVNVRIPNAVDIPHLCGSISRQMDMDSLEILSAFQKTDWLKDYHLEQKKAFIIPNTYRFFWSMSADDLINRLKKEHDKFWNETRKKQLKNSTFSELEVVTLASVVQKEAKHAIEQPTVAGLYLNRISQNMKLESDPTAVYGYQKTHGFHPPIYRVYYKHTQFPSEYNTYLNEGLPPAPICLPNPSAIDAVLNPKEHNYIYMMASAERQGYHEFAETYAEHDENVKKYHRLLDEQGIK